ncbi:MAG: 1-acyl-sn-glycerol-3-phosphate acyltransferase, partial [Propionibacteriaceae bacterium]|nr:1-acyl-sn-glycerol-3-phosphate acyltransferase [Propionibacteriaceae bacterium]
VVIAGNHIGTGETFLLPAFIKRPLTFAAKKELFQGTTLWRRFARRLLLAIHQVPIDRAGGSASAGALRSVETVLAEGGVVGFFPEGKRSPDGRLYKGHTGFARLALDQGAVVVPVGCIHTDFRQGWLPWPWCYKPELHFGEPIRFPDQVRQAYLAAPTREESGAILRQVTDDVMRAIQAITGQEYVDEYARRQKPPPK